MLEKLKFVSLVMSCWVASRLPAFAREIELRLTIRDADGTGLARAQIRSVEGEPIATADEQGRICASLMKGAVIRVEAKGYLPLRVNVSQILDGRILLRAIAARRAFVPTVHVSAFRMPVAAVTSPAGALVASVRVLSAGAAEPRTYADQGAAR